MLSASWVVIVGMGVLGVGVAGLFAWASARVAPGRAWVWPLATAAWLGLLTVLAMSGLLNRWDVRPPPLMAIVLVAIAGSVALAFSSHGRRLATQLPLWALVGVQAFRLPLELVMFRAHSEAVMPEQMSFAGYNFDVVTGLTALVVALWLKRGNAPRAVVVVWNVLGSALLVTIMGIAIASTPMAAAFGPDRLNTWVAFFPAVFLPLVLVPAALVGHLVIFRRLASDATRSPAARAESAASPV